MVRRIGVVVAVAIVGVAALPGVSQAYQRPVEAHGAIACFWKSGKITLKPGFVNGGTSVSTVRFHGVIGDCKNSEEPGPAPFGISSGKMKGSFQVPANACDFDDVGDSTLGGPGEATIKWKGSRKLVPTKVTAPDVGYEIGINNSFSYPQSFSSHGVPVTGSFAGGANVFADGNPALDLVQRSCMPRTKGVKSSGGLKKMEICPNTDCYALAFFT